MSLLLLFGLGVWARLSGPAAGNCRDIDVNPLNPRVLLACTWDGSSGGVYRSTDWGASWQPAANGISPEMGYGMNAVRFCPADTTILVCATGFLGGNGLFLSTDCGQSWSLTGFAGGQVSDIVFLPGSRDTFYTVEYGRVQRTTDRGQNWQELVRLSLCRGAAFKPGSRSVLFLGAYRGLYRSTDAGRSWDSCGFRIPCYDLEFDRLSPETLYVAGHVQGVFKVWSDGDSWELLGNSDHYNTTIQVDSARRELYTGGFAFSPVSGRVCLGRDLGQAWREFGPDRYYDNTCIDLCLPEGDSLVYAGGNYFGVQRYSRRDSIWHPSSAGICEANVRAVALGPEGSGVVYTGSSVLGVSVSTDDGVSWRTGVNTPVSGLAHNTEVLPPGLACSPSSADSVYATFWGHAPPVQVVFRSTDQGRTWGQSRVPDLRESDFLNTLAVHWTGPETLYLASTRGVFKSTDAGIGWRLGDSIHCYHVAVDRHEPGIVYASGIGQVRRSTDAGSTWHDFSLGLSNMCDVMMVESDPDSAGLLYAALCGLETHTPLSGIYVYRPQAGRWERKSAGLPGTFVVRPRVAVDEVNRCVWAITPLQGQGVYRSFDRGESWLPADSGLSTNGAYFIASGQRTYLGTRGDGLWVFEPGAGKSEEPEALAGGAGTGPTVVGSFRLPDGTGPAALFDGCGRVRLESDGLGPGVYFLVAGRRVVKLVKVR